MPERIIINDVGPRDGLQNQARLLEPADRLRLIQALLDAGLRHVEVAAFVSPKAVPGTVFIPFHYAAAAANRLTNAALDPVSGIPEYKVCAVKLSKTA